MKSKIEIIRRFKARWGAECFWSGLAGILADLPLCIYLARLDIFEIAYLKETLSAGKMVLCLFVILFSILASLFVNGFSGWLVGFYIRKIAIIGKRMGDVFYGSILYGMFMMLPIGMYAGYLMSDGINQFANMILAGVFSAGGLVGYISSIFRISIATAAPTLLGGISGAVVGMALNKTFSIMKFVQRKTL
jgi:hypothetical protein